MSFDLCVWHERAPITAAEARAKLKRAAETDDDASFFEQHPAVLEFHGSVLRRFPSLESLADADIHRLGVWSVTPTASNRLVSLTISWAHVSDVAPTVMDLARAHGVVCYNPSDHVLWPNAPGYRPEFTLSSQNGPFVPDPDDQRIESVVSSLGPDNFYAILERRDGWYVQVGYGNNIGVPAGTYAMEYREGTPDRHFRAETTDASDVVQFMQEFPERPGNLADVSCLEPVAAVGKPRFGPRPGLG